MGASPTWKVYDKDNRYIASFVDVYSAAQFIALEPGRNVRYGHPAKNTVWTQEGTGFGDEIPDPKFGIIGDAGESYDAVAEAAAARFPFLFTLRG